MNQSEYDVVAGGLMQLAREIEVSKRPGYTRGDDDVLANFKRAGAQAGITTEQAWAVFFLKHIDAILSIMTKPHLAVSEAAEGRFADAVNYLRLGFAILRERESAPPVDNEIAPVFARAGQESMTYGDPVHVPSTQVFGVAAAFQEVAHAIASTEGERFAEIPAGAGGGFGYVLKPEAKMGPK